MRHLGLEPTPAAFPIVVLMIAGAVMQEHVCENAAELGEFIRTHERSVRPCILKTAPWAAIAPMMPIEEKIEPLAA